METQVECLTLKFGHRFLVTRITSVNSAVSQVIAEIIEKRIKLEASGPIRG